MIKPTNETSQFIITHFKYAPADDSLKFINENFEYLINVKKRGDNAAEAPVLLKEASISFIKEQIKWETMRPPLIDDRRFDNFADTELFKTAAVLFDEPVEKLKNEFGDFLKMLGIMK